MNGRFRMWRWLIHGLDALFTLVLNVAIGLAVIFGFAFSVLYLFELFT